MPPPPPPPIQLRPLAPVTTSTPRATTPRRIATTTARITTSTTTRAPTSSRPPPPAAKKPIKAVATPPPYNVKGGIDFSRVEKEQKNADKSEWTPIAEEEFVMHREPVGEAAVVSTLQEIIDTDSTSKLPSRSYSGLGHVRPMPTLFPAKKNSSPEPSTTSTTAAPSSRATPGSDKDVNSPFFMSSLSSLPPPPPAKISATYKQQDIAMEKPLMDAASPVLTNTHIRVKESDRRLDQEPVSGSMKMGGTLSESRGSQDVVYKPVPLIPEKAQNSSDDSDEDFVKIPVAFNNSASIPVYIVHNTEKTTAEPEPIFTIEMTEEEEPMTFTTVMKDFSEDAEEQTEAFTEEIFTTVTPLEEVEDVKPIATEAASKVGPTLSSLLLKPLTASQRTAEVDSTSPIKAGLLYREPKSGPASSAIKDSLIQGFPKNEFNSVPAFLRRNNTIKKPTTVVTTTVRQTLFINIYLTKFLIYAWFLWLFSARTDHSDGAGGFELLLRRSAAGAGSRSQIVRRCRRLLGFLG